MTKLNVKQIATGYAAATASAVTTGLIVGYLWQHLGGETDYTLTVGGTWLATVGLPSLGVSATSLKRVLGKRPSPPAVSAAPARAIPYSSNGKSGYVFSYSIPALGWMSKGDQDAKQHPVIDLPDAFSVRVGETDYTLTAPEIDNFLRRSWARQRSGQAGLSRAYWTKTARPALSRQEYEARMALVLSVPRLVINRGERRSGRLSVPPETARRAILGQFTLG